VLHDSMPNDPIQGQGHGGPKAVKMADVFAANLHVIKRLTVNSDTPRHIWIFSGQICEIYPYSA